MDRLSLHSSSHKYSQAAAEALSHGLNFKIFLGEHAPTPPYKTVHAIYTWPRSRAFERRTASEECAKAGNEGSVRMDKCVLRASHQNPPYMYAPPSSISGYAPALLHSSMALHRSA